MSAGLFFDTFVLKSEAFMANSSIRKRDVFQEKPACFTLTFDVNRRVIVLWAEMSNTVLLLAENIGYLTIGDQHIYK